jgi:pentatricopeptide repeat protein
MFLFLWTDRLLGVLMDTYVHIGDTERAKEVFNTIENPDDDKVAILIKAAIKEKDFRNAQLYLAKKPTRALLNTYVEACIHTAGGLDQALQILETVDPELPDIGTYNAVLKCANEENPERAVLVLERLPIAPDRVTYNLAMNTCYRLGQYDRARYYLEAMKNDGHEPDSWTYVEMLKLIADPEAMELYLVGSIPSPNIFHYNIVLQAWAKNKRLPALVDLMGRMKNHGVPADVNTYTCAIVAFTTSGQAEYVERADALLAEMEQQQQQQQNLPPDIVHYEAVLLAWSKLNDAARATKVLIRRIHAATERPALAPVPANFHHITGMWIQSGNPKQAALILLRLYDFVDQGLLQTGPDERTRHMIASTLVRENKPDEYLPIVEQLNLRRREVKRFVPSVVASVEALASSSSSLDASSAPASRNDNNDRTSPNHQNNAPPPQHLSRSV